MLLAMKSLTLLADTFGHDLVEAVILITVFSEISLDAQQKLWVLDVTEVGKVTTIIQNHGRESVL